MKKIKSSFIFIILCLSIISMSCSSNTPESSDDMPVNANESASDNVEAEETTEIAYDAHLPDLDLEGREFRILNIDEQSMWWSIVPVDAESEIGEVINDSIYTRNRIVEEKYNILVKETKLPEGSMATAVTNLVKSGSDDYDIVIPRESRMGTFSSQGMLLNLNTLPYIDLANPWWGNSAADFSILNKTYFATSDFILTDKENVSIMMYNKNIARDLGLMSDTELYQLVLDGKWTHGKFVEMIKSASADLNGDGIRDVQDRYGFMAIDWGYSALMASSGERFSTKNANDLPVFTANNERFISVYGEIMELMNNRDYVIRSGIDFNHEELWGDIFTNDQALFCQEILSCVRLFADMRSDFAVIPLPKFDETQDKYYSYGVWATCIGVPVTVSDPENVALILDALSSLSHQLVIPAYYEVAIALKYLRDDISFKMLDIILENVICDPLRMVYDWGGFNSKFQSSAIAGNTDIVSLLEQYADRVEVAIQKTVDAYEALS